MNYMKSKLIFASRTNFLRAPLNETIDRVAASPISDCLGYDLRELVTADIMSPMDE